MYPPVTPPARAWSWPAVRGPLALVVVSIVAAVVAARVGFDGRWLWFYDVPKVSYPNAVFWHEQATRLELPLWIDRLGLGFPVYAEGQIGSFYLPNFVLALFEPVVSLDLTRTAHLAFAGIGAGLIARRLTGTWIAALVAGVAAALSGGIVGKLEWTNVVIAYAWAPWVLLPLVRRPAPSHLGLVGAGIAWGISGLASHPNTWLLVGLAAAVLLLATAPGRATVARIAAFGMIGLGVAAVQLVPTLVLWSLSPRTGGLPPWDLFSNSATPLDILLPGFANAFLQAGPDGWDIGTQWYPGGPWGLHEAGAYLGLPMLALAGLGAAARRSVPLVVVAVVMVGIAAVGAFHPSFWTDTPILNGLRHPARSYMIACLAGSILAGVGIARVGLSWTSIRPAVLIVGGSVAAYAVVTLIALERPTLFAELVAWGFGTPPESTESLRQSAVRALTAPFPLVLELAAGGLALLVIALAGRRPVRIGTRLTVRPWHLRFGLVGLAAFPLVAFSGGVNGDRPFDQVSQAGNPYARTVLGLAPHRFVALIDPLWYDGIPNQLPSAGISELSMFSSLNLAATDRLVDEIRHPEADPDLARAVGIDVMATFGDEPCPGTGVVDLERDSASICRLDAAPRPPYWLPDDVVGAASDVSVTSAFGRAMLGLFGGVPVDRAIEPDRAIAAARPGRVVTWSETSAEIAVDAPAAGWLYVDRAWWPAWRVTVDGAQVTPQRALGGQLVPVPAGPSIVRQEFVPVDIWFGLGLGLLTIVVAALAALAVRRSRPGPAEVEFAPFSSEPPAELPQVTASAPPADAEPPGTVDASEPTPPPAEPPGEPWSIEPIPPRVLVGMLAGLAGAAILTWLVPPLGAVLVWPVLFAIPGWIVIGRVAPNLPAPGQIGLAVVISVFGSAHLVNVVARLDGFGQPAVLAASILLVLGSVVFARVRSRHLAPLRAPSVRAVRIALRRDAGAWIVAAAVGLTVLVILEANAWVETDQGWVSGGWNWSDFLVHVSIGQSIVGGNFPPEVPYFAGVPLTYHWFADFHGAIGASAAGIHVIPVFIATSALFAAVLALLSWSLAYVLTGRRRVATIATILICLGGGMGWLRLIGDVIGGATDVVELVTRLPYDNTWADGWPWFRVASIFGTGFFPHRATTLGLPGLVAVVLLVVSCLGRRPAGVLLAGILAAFLAPFHFHAFPATYLIVLLYVVATGAWRQPTARRDAVLFLAPIVLAIPFVATAVFRQSDLGAFRFVQGWSEARIGEGPLAGAFFYLTNLGVPFVLALVAAVRIRRTGPGAFLLLWLVALFAVPNLVVLSSVEFDMNKYFQIMWIAVAILAAVVIARWPRPVIAAILVVSALSPALIGIWHLRNPAVVMTKSQEAAGRWIEHNTPQRSVFVTDSYINSPVDIAGRLRLTTFGPYVANLGYDPEERGADVQAIYCDGPEEAARLMTEYGAAYVLSSGGILDCADGEPTDFGAGERFETVYDRDGTRVWRLRGP